MSAAGVGGASVPYQYYVAPCCDQSPVNILFYNIFTRNGSIDTQQLISAICTRNVQSFALSSYASVALKVKPKQEVGLRH